MLIAYQIGVDLLSSSKGPVYSVTDDAAMNLISLSSKSAAYFDEVVRICSTNLIFDAPLPEDLRVFAALVIEGRRKRPKAGHRPRKKNWLELSFLFRLGLRARDRFGLNLTRNDEASHSHSACDALAEALTICGRRTSYSEVKRIFVHRDYATFREEHQKIREAAQHKRNVREIVEALTKASPPGIFAKYLSDGWDK